MFPVTITISNIADLQKVQSVLYPTTAVAEVKVEAPKPQKPATTAAAASSQPSAKKQASAPTTETADPKPAATPASQPAAAPASTASSEKASASLDYATLQKAVFTLANTSREAAGEVAASFGVKTFKELDASKWGEALAAVNAKLESLQVA